MTENNIFYVYVYMDPTKPGNFIYDDLKLNYEPFYVGKGRGNRYKMHIIDAKWRQKTKKRKLSHMHNKILKIQNPIILKIKENLLEKDAFEIEKKYILLIGRYDIGNGPLCNMSNGGDGQSGRIPWNKNKTGSLTKNKNSEKEIDLRIDKYILKNRGIKRGRNFNYKQSEKVKETSSRIIREVNRKRKEMGLGSGFKGKTFTQDVKNMIKKTWLQKRGHLIKVYYFIKDNKLLIIRGLINYCKNINISGGNMTKLFNKKIIGPYHGHTIIDEIDIIKWKDNYIIIDYYKNTLKELNFNNVLDHIKNNPI